jgi:hypothetical protein
MGLYVREGTGESPQGSCCYAMVIHGGARKRQSATRLSGRAGCSGSHRGGSDKHLTIAVSLKVNEGLVLATDSASTIIETHGRRTTVHRVYNNANKITNLRKGSPVGLMSWGAGNIGQASVSTLAKDLRRRLSGRDPDHKDWAIDPHNYTVEDVASKTRTFLYTERYRREYPGRARKPSLGMVIGGYSTRGDFAEEWRIDIQNGSCDGPRLWKPPSTYGVSWDGQPEALSRLINGFSIDMPRVLRDRLSVPDDQIPGSHANPARRAAG